MFREMRRNKQLLSVQEVAAIMHRCTNGILACLGDEGYPYAVPLNYVYHDDKLYFHCAKTGHKLDAILKNPKVSFAVVDEDTIVSEKYTSYFRSVIAFGEARIVQGEERLASLKALIEKYSADQPEDSKQRAISECDRAYMIAIDIHHITGKQAIELVKKGQ